MIDAGPPADRQALRAVWFARQGDDARAAEAARVAMSVPDVQTCVRAFAQLEPPPLEAKVLTLRARCYARANHPRAETASAELLRILEQDTTFGASIPTPPAAPSPSHAVDPRGSTP